MIKIEHYAAYNKRRYGQPWIAPVGVDHKPVFTERVGGYTGQYGSGEEGDLYLNDPVEGAVYMYGQKDYRGRNTENYYIKIVNGDAKPCNKLGEIAEEQKGDENK